MALLVYISIVSLCCLMLTSSETVTTDEQAMVYLERYGYMGTESPDPDMAGRSDEEAMPFALKDFQTMMGLNVTGVLDDETLIMMNKPRCGVKDRLSRRDIMKRKKRFATGGMRWSSSLITYKFNSYTPDLSNSVTESVVAQAFQLWSAATNLRFQKVDVNQNAIVEIEFVAGDHGDGNPFDGPGGTLAHAYFPSSNPLGGDAHFDEAEQFTDQTSQGINLLFVAVHEFGHSLGLSHSAIQDAIMFPTYSGYIPNLQLNQDDIAGIRFLYGDPTTTSTTTTTTSTTTTTAASTTSTTTSTTTPSPGTKTRAEFCNDGSVDGIGRLGGQVYAFQGNSYVRLDPELGIAPGYPRLIQNDWTGLTGGIDAVLDSPDQDYIFIFKGTQVWRYTFIAPADFVLSTNYPRAIGTQFRGGLPDNIDMAMVWSGNGRSYVFKGLNYYRLSTSGTFVDSGYPKSVEIWNLPDLDQDYGAAFQASNSRTYFFAGQEFIRYNDMNFESDPEYPLLSKDRWFKCAPDDEMEMDQDPEQVPTIDPEFDNNPSCGSTTITSTLTILFVISIHQLYQH